MYHKKRNGKSICKGSVNGFGGGIKPVRCFMANIVEVNDSRKDPQDKDVRAVQNCYLGCASRFR